MSFLSPLAFAFLATIPVVVVFYLLKRKRVVRLVSSTVLWQRFLADTQASAPFQKLRRNWLLVLQILLLLLAVLALARPFIATDMKPAELRVIILDGSASMQSTDEKPSRFERARGEAMKWVDGLKGADQMVVLLAGANTEVKQSATSEKAALRRALQSCQASDSPTRLVPALRMAESLVRDQRSAEIHLFSDGAVSGLEEFENKALPLVFHRFGQSSENVGITALDVRSNPENRDERAIYASVVNHSTNAQTVAVELLFDGVRQETRPVRVGPDESAPQVFLVTQPRDGVFTVRLAATDDLKADNQASIVSLLPQPVNVLLVTRGNRLLEKALQSVGNVRLSVVPDLTETAEYDFVVLDNLAPSYWPKGNVLAYRVAGTNWIESFTELTAPPIVDWRPTHPLLRYAGFENVQIARGVGAKVPGWAVSIADAPQASLILAGELGRQRIVWIGFDILESNWPLRVSFPIFMANAVDWLNPAAVSSASLMVKGGDPFRYALPRPEPRAKVTLPSGETRDLDLSGSPNELVFAETQRQGAYRVQAGTNNLVFCVNLLDAAESNTRPKAEIQLGQHASVQATAVRRANMEVWRTIAAFALVLLLGEWWYYHRRTV